MLSASAFGKADNTYSILIIPDITKTSSTNCLKYPRIKSTCRWSLFSKCGVWEKSYPVSAAHPPILMIKIFSSTWSFFHEVLAPLV